MSVFRESVEIVNNRGLHARASAKFVNMVALLPEGIEIVWPRQSVYVRSLPVLSCWRPLLTERTSTHTLTAVTRCQAVRPPTVDWALTSAAVRKLVGDCSDPSPS